MSSNTSKENTDRIRQNEDRLAELYEEYYNRISYYVYVRIGNKDEAQDIASEVFLKAFKEEHKGEGCMPTFCDCSFVNRDFMYKEFDEDEACMCEEQMIEIGSNCATSEELVEAFDPIN